MSSLKKSQLDNFQVLQWNCRSLKSNITYLLHHLNSHNYDVLLLQSLNVIPSKIPYIAGFYYPPIIKARSTDNIIQTAIFIREKLTYIDNSSTLNINATDIYACSATIKVNGSFIINVASVYLPKGPNDQNTEWMRIFSFDDQLNGKWLIGGDFNAHSPFWEKKCELCSNNRFVENIVDSNLILLNDGSITRIPDISKHRATAIDLTLTSPEIAPLCSWETYEDSLGSDHLPIQINISLNRNPNPSHDRTKDTIPKYNYKKANWNRFKSFISSQNLDNIFYDHDDIDTLYSTFQALIIKAADLSIPKLNSSIPKKFQGNIWWNSECEIAIKTKKEKYKQYIKNKTESSHHEMKLAKNNCNRVIYKAKQEYWNSFCTKDITNFNDSKKIWKKLHDMKSKERLPSFPIKLGNNQFPSDLDKAEAFVDFFSTNSRSEGLSTNSKMFRNEIEMSTLENNYNIHQDIFINAPITLDEVHKAIFSLKNKNVSVGIDIISNDMIKNFPQNAVLFLHNLFNICWEKGTLPKLWKVSILVPIHKSGKSSKDINNYRPIALTSHLCKLFEYIILQRLAHFCEKQNIIPNNQAGFRKGRSTTEHLVKLSTQIKHQFSRRRSVLATFFDVKKAYDQVWHHRLLYKLSSIGLKGNIYEYIKDFLANRSVLTRVGKNYSTPRNLEMGIPQGSIIAPILFNILIFDLPKVVSNFATIVQYADDICMWMNVTLKGSTSLRSQNHIRRLYQANIDSISTYMQQNGLSLSTEKTNLVLFNAGDNPSKLPIFKLEGTALEYKKNVKFLGIIFTSKLTWNLYFDYILTKARQNLNLLKIIAKLPWGKDSETLIHLSTALIRSQLSYGQEIFFTAPKYLLKKLQSIDCKAYKLALGVPIHTSNLAVYKLTGSLPLDEYRELATSKFLIKGSMSNNFIQEELKLRSDINFPKRAKTIHSQMTIATYTHNLIEESGIDILNDCKSPTFIPIPPWELMKPSFDMDYTNIKKDENTNILTTVVKSHIFEKYKNHLQIFTDGSLLNKDNIGAAFTIPSLKIEKSFSLNNNLSIFTAELTAILVALEFLLEISNDVSESVLFVDSKSVLQTLEGCLTNTRPDIVYEIYYLLYCLSMSGTSVSFCWIPSHCNIYGNELADKYAKRAASKNSYFSTLHIHPSIKDLYTCIVNTSFKKTYKNMSDRSYHLKLLRYIKRKLYNSSPYYYRQISSTTFRLIMNSFKTKFSNNITCICGEKISRDHILFNCPAMMCFLPNSLSDTLPSEDCLPKLFNDFPLLIDIVESLLLSPIGHFL